MDHVRNIATGSATSIREQRRGEREQDIGSLRGIYVSDKNSDAEIKLPIGEVSEEILLRVSSTYVLVVTCQLTEDCWYSASLKSTIDDSARAWFHRAGVGSVINRGQESHLDAQQAYSKTRASPRIPAAQKLLRVIESGGC